ncbi:MAG: hypothetical protein Q4C54_01375, partial [Clostridia bacterium]|nr:hypothetical protein [Clostridia bacterium]
LVIDAAQIAKSCDGTVLVIKYNAVSRRELVHAKNQLEQTGCPLLGTVLSMVDYDSFLSKSYYNRSYYDYYAYAAGAGEHHHRRKKGRK